MPAPEAPPKTPENDEVFTFENAAATPEREHAEQPAPGPAPFAYAPGDRPGATPPRPAAPRPAPEVRRREPRESLESALGRKWLLAVGIVVIVFGLGYFLKYTFDQGWIGPPGQLGLGYAFSAALLAAGELTRRRGYAMFGLWVIAGGMAGIYAATFAGHRVLELMPQAPAFGVLAAATVATVALAVLHNAPGLAVLGLLGGYLTPFVLEDLDNMYFLLGFVTLLNAGVLAVSLLRPWNGLHWMGLTASYIIHAFWQLSDYLPRFMWGETDASFWVSIVFVNLTFLGYAIVPLLGGLLPSWAGRGRTRLTASAWLGAAAAYGAALFTFFPVAERYSKEWTALPALGYAAVFAAMAWFAGAIGPHGADEADEHPRETGHLAVLRGHAALFFLLAGPLALGGHWITAAWALQGALLFWLGLRLGGRGLYFMGALAVLFSLLRLLLLDLEDSWGLTTHSGLETLQGALYTYYGGFSALLAERWTVEGIVLGALGFCAWAASRNAEEDAESWTAAPPGSGLLRLAFGLGLLTVLSVECAAWFGESAPAARAASVSVLWALYATTLVFHGFRNDRKGARLSGLLLYGLTLMKVVLVDMEDVAAPWRIISFLVLGGLLVGGSFLYHRQGNTNSQQADL